MLSVAQPLFQGGNYNLPKYYQLHSHSSKAVISICQNVGQLHSHWKLQPAKILSVTQPLFRGCNFNLPKCWWVTQPLFRGGITTYRNIISYTATLPRRSFQSAEMLVSYTATLLHHPTVGRLVITLTPLSAAWSSLQPHCRPPGHHSNISCRPPHQPHHPTVGRPIRPTTPLSADWSLWLVITYTYPVGRLVSSPTPLSADPLLAWLLCGRPGPLDRC